MRFVFKHYSRTPSKPHRTAHSCVFIAATPPNAAEKSCGPLGQSNVAKDQKTLVKSRVVNSYGLKSLIEKVELPGRNLR